VAAVLALAAPAAAEPAAGAKVEAAVRAVVTKHLEKHHLRPDLVDPDALAAEARRRSEQRGSTAWIDVWLTNELHRAEWAFAPTDARPDPAARYALPFDPVFPRNLGQGEGGTDSHTGDTYHAFDFVMPVGTEVRAAREGVVARVVDGFTEGGADRALAPFANTVVVLHDDGTFALYTHLSPGIPVKEGQRVTRGQALARSGQTGWSTAPHLHFAVHRREHDGLRTIPIRFGRPGGPGFVPKEGEWVGFLPTPTIDLAVYADGALVPPGTLLPRRSGESALIRVEARPAHGPARDITGHPRLHLVSMTPWNLEVVGPSEVTIRPMKEFPDWGLDFDVAAVGVFFLNEREIGLGKVEFHLIDADSRAKR
jgi:murein DD-endopeptidase MepM/ murein hydrolase activator NlpD